MTMKHFEARGAAASYERQKTHDKKQTKKAGLGWLFGVGFSTVIATLEALRDLIFSARRPESTLGEL